jgi:hypothetical protein
MSTLTFKMIYCVTTVNLNLSGKEAIEILGREPRVWQNLNWKTVEEMPKATLENVNVTLFRCENPTATENFCDDDLVEIYRSLGLEPADPYTLASINEADPEFADTHPNATHWKNKDGEWCFATFSLEKDKREVWIRPCYSGNRCWLPHWWFAGVKLS